MECLIKNNKIMDFSNLTVTFKEEKETGSPMTVYQFGKSKVTIKNCTELYYIEYINEDCMKLCEDTTKLPELFCIYIKRLYEAFNITSKDIESTIKSIQAWERRK